MDNKKTLTHGTDTVIAVHSSGHMTCDITCIPYTATLHREGSTAVHANQPISFSLSFSNLNLPNWREADWSARTAAPVLINSPQRGVTDFLPLCEISEDQWSRLVKIHQQELDLSPAEDAVGCVHSAAVTIHDAITTIWLPTMQQAPLICMLYHRQ